MSPYFTGLLFGLIFIFSIGPAFFSLIQTSVQKGLKKSMLLALGISLSDILYVILAIMGVSSLLERPITKLWLGIVGTVILIVYGVYSWFKKPKVYKDEIENKKDLSYLKYVAKGFILNGFNPFIVVFWVSIIGLVATNYDFTYFQQIYFFAGVLTTILCTDITKAFIAHRLRSMVTPRKILILNRSVGVILILFGMQMIYFLLDTYVM
ncbi:MAG: LysE family transporter [Marinoscillum sp.]